MVNSCDCILTLLRQRNHCFIYALMSRIWQSSHMLHLTLPLGNRIDFGSISQRSDKRFKWLMNEEKKISNKSHSTTSSLHRIEKTRIATEIFAVEISSSRVINFFTIFASSAIRSADFYRLVSSEKWVCHFFVVFFLFLYTVFSVVHYYLLRMFIPFSV